MRVVVEHREADLRRQASLKAFAVTISACAMASIFSLVGAEPPHHMLTLTRLGPQLITQVLDRSSAAGLASE